MVFDILMHMDIQWNPDAGEVLAGMVKRIQIAVEEVADEYLGRPVDEVRPVLAARWAAANEGAQITEPDLTRVAALISDGKRVWVTDDGTIMAED